MLQKDFLFEIGLEEIPTGYIKNAIDKLDEYFRKGLSSAKLDYTSIEKLSTPRRLALRILELPVIQPDETIEKIGPALTVAYDEKGNLTRAALGFLKSAEAESDQIFTVKTAKGDKIAIRKKIQGRGTDRILSDLMVGSLSTLSFPKMMRWGDNNTQFARPLRWLIALFGEHKIEIDYHGLKTDQFSYGNRFLDLSIKTRIDKPSEYENRLNDINVIPVREKRKNLIRSQIDQLLSGLDIEIVADERLLDEVVDLVEFPTAALATFDSNYMKLPEKIVTSTLSQHQRYFGVKNKNGILTNRFIFVSNGNPEFIKLIRKGNEKVVKARLEDAEFYYLEDTKLPLDRFVEKLKEVTFQKNLGSLYNKTLRIQEIAKYICNKLGFNKQITGDCIRAAYLCKADLVTLMLGEKEFTKLQGYIGMNYARKSGENEQVAKAIYEHYLPRGQKDSLPESITGAVVALSDKLDTVCGIISVGLIPTGSNDPFALRRAANGIVQIIAEHGFILDLHEMLEETLRILSDNVKDKKATMEFITEYFRQRVYWLLKESRVDYDVIDSVMHIDYSDIVDLKHRALDLQEFKQRADFRKLIIGFKRVSNIISETDNISDVNPDLFKEQAEKDLFTGSQSLGSTIEILLKSKNYHGIMEELVRFGPVIDSFFDHVLVNIDDDKLRQNRYNLLANIRSLFLKIADIAKIVLEGQ